MDDHQDLDGAATAAGDEAASEYDAAADHADSTPPVSDTPPDHAADESAATVQEAGDDSSLTDQVDAVDEGAQADASQPDQPSDIDVAELQRKVEEMRSYIGRSQRELGETRKRLQAWGELDPQETQRQLEEYRKREEALALKPYNRQHPDHQRTMAKFQLVEQAMKASNAAKTEDQQELVRQLYGGQVTEQDVAAYQEWQAYRSQVRDEFEGDPEGFIYSRMEARLQERLDAEFEARERMQHARSTSTEWLQNNQDLVKNYGQEIQWAMSSPQRRDVGLKLAQVLDENRKLKAQLGDSEESVATARAQQEALSGKARVPSSARTAPAGDPVADAKKQGLRGAALLEHLREANGSR